jgi:hypothetical protein
MKPEFRFRLNGIVVPEIRIQRAMIDGQPVGDLQIAVRDEDIGWFTIDGNEHLWDKRLPRFILEYRNETEWSRTDPLQRRISKDKGWKTVTTQKLLRMLQTAGYINVDDCRGE